MGRRVDRRVWVEAKATASFLPSYSGDGYGYGGGALVTIAGMSISIGESRHGLADEIERRWNSFPGLLAAARALMPDDFYEHPQDFADEWQNLATAIAEAEVSRG